MSSFDTANSAEDVYKLLAPLGENVEVFFDGLWRTRSVSDDRVPFNLVFTEGPYIFRIVESLATDLGLDGARIEIQNPRSPEGFETLRSWVDEMVYGIKTGRDIAAALKPVGEALARGEAVVLISVPGLDEEEVRALTARVAEVAALMLAAKSVTRSFSYGERFADKLEEFEATLKRIFSTQKH
jgi:hypothetical protein